MDIKAADGTSDLVPELCTGGKKFFSAVVTPNVSGTFSWSTTSGKMTIVGVGTDLVTVDAGIFPSTTAEDENLRVEFTPSGSSVSCGAEIDLTIFSVEPVSVDITDDIAPAEVNYTLHPSDGTLSTCTFTAPGITETRADVSGDFYFSYNQADLVPGNNSIRLSYLSCQADISASKQAVPKGPANEIVLVTYPENLDPPVIVTIPITHEISAERYWRITYSGASVVPRSHTLHIGSADVMVEAPGSRDISWVLENHWYHDNNGNHCEQGMSLVTGAMFPPPVEYRRFYESSDDVFFIPGNGLTGIAQLEDIAFDDNGAVVQSLNVANEKVDQVLE